MNKHTITIIFFVFLTILIFTLLLMPSSFFEKPFNQSKIETLKVEVWEEKGEEANGFFYNDTYISGMHYRTFSYWEKEGGAAVVNITKDSLEVILLIQQLKTKLP